MRRANRAVSRSAIIEAVWGFNEDVETNTVDVYIKQLREKVDTDLPAVSSTPSAVSGTFSVIKTIRFRLTASYTALLALTFFFTGIAIWLALEHSVIQTADANSAPALPM